MHFIHSFLSILSLTCISTILTAANPIITEIFTADPAAMVYKETMYLYAGQDDAKSEKDGYRMPRWVCYSSTDLKTWTAHGSPLSPKDFAWAKDSAWAGQVIERDGKFFWYVAVEHGSIRGKAIGVAVSDSPTGPFKDARGTALVTNDMTKAVGHSWDDIDPTVFIEDNGQAWLFWGNTKCYYAKLKADMIELDGPIQTATLEAFEEAPWLHRRNGLYYLSYASGFPERIAYSTSTSLSGPWTYKGILAEVAGNSNTIHQSIIEFKGDWYFIYHNGSMPRPNIGGSNRRAVCIDRLFYHADGTMKRVVQTTEGLDAPAP